jgi:hypothetical protein
MNKKKFFNSKFNKKIFTYFSIHFTKEIWKKSKKKKINNLFFMLNSLIKFIPKFFQIIWEIKVFIYKKNKFIKKKKKKIIPVK